MSVTKKGQWREADMKDAIAFVLEERRSVRVAAERFNVSKSTLFDRCRRLASGTEVMVKPDMGHFQNTFTEETATKLIEFVKEMDNKLLPLTKKEFLKIAYDMAKALKISHRFNLENKVSGKQFYYSFMKRHPELALRMAQSTSL